MSHTKKTEPSPRSAAGAEHHLYDFADVAAKSDLARLVAQDLGHEPDLNGRYICPFHEDCNPSLHVFVIGKPRYHCFRCAAGGDALDWLVRRHGLPPAEAARYLVENGFCSSEPDTVRRGRSPGRRARRSRRGAAAAPRPPEPLITRKKESSRPTPHSPPAPAAAVWTPPAFAISPPAPTTYLSSPAQASDVSDNQSAARPARAPANVRPKRSPETRRQTITLLAQFVTRHAEERLWSDVGVGALAWLKRRGLTEETIATARLGYGLGGGLGKKEYGIGVARGIWVPFFGPKGVPFAGQVRRLNHAFLNHDDGNQYYNYGRVSRLLYPTPPKPGIAQVFLCEGSFEALLLAQEVTGLDVEVVALVSASARSDRFEAASLDPLRGRPVFVVTDNDAAGDVGGEQARPW